MKEAFGCRGHLHGLRERSLVYVRSVLERERSERVGEVKSLGLRFIFMFCR